jgi:hypothetical protein
MKSAYLSLGLSSILIHSGQGLLNSKTAHWNSITSIDQNVNYVYDWRYPQFLVTTQSFYERARYYMVQDWKRDESQFKGGCCLASHRSNGT